MQLIGGSGGLAVACDKLLACGDATCVDCCRDVGVGGEGHRFNVAVPCGDISVTLDGFRPRKFWNGSSCVTVDCGNCEVFNDTFVIEKDPENCWTWDTTFLNVGDNSSGACAGVRYLSIRIVLSLRCCGYTDGADRHHVIYWIGQVISGYLDIPMFSTVGLNQSSYNFIKILDDVVEDDGCTFIDRSGLGDVLGCRIPPLAPESELLEECMTGSGWIYPPATGRCSPFDYEPVNCPTGDPGTMTLSI